MQEYGFSLTDTFQSTLPVKGATKSISWKYRTWKFQSTLPVKGATISDSRLYDYLAISIHAPREGSDQDKIDAAKANKKFQSTLPVKGATSFADRQGGDY